MGSQIEATFAAEVTVDRAGDHGVLRSSQE